MPKTQITLSKLAHAQSIFSSLIYLLVPSLFFSVPGHLQCFISVGRGFRKTFQVQEVHFKAFQVACETSFIGIFSS